MAVTWVAASAPVGAQSTSIGATTPAGIANDDVLLAAVFAVSSITAPSGWTQVAATTTFTDGVLLGRLELWKKNSEYATSTTSPGNGYAAVLSLGWLVAPKTY